MLPHVSWDDKQLHTPVCRYCYHLLMLKCGRREQDGKYDNSDRYDRKRRRPPEWRPLQFLSRLCGLAIAVVVGAIHGVEIGHGGDCSFGNRHSLEKTTFGVGIESHHAGQSRG